MKFPEKITEDLKSDMYYAESYQDFVFLRKNKTGTEWTREQYINLLLNNLGY